MYAIVEIGGYQWKVSKKETLKVPKIEAEPGKTINLDQVLLIVDGEKVNIGKPLVSDATVKAKVVSHGRGKKVMVFKKKRRKDYKVKKGHRQDFTEITIESIGFGKTVKKTADSKADAKPAPKTEKKAAPAKSAEKKTEPKKETVKKTAKPTETITATKQPAAPKKASESKEKE